MRASACPRRRPSERACRRRRTAQRSRLLRGPSAVLDQAVTHVGQPHPVETLGQWVVRRYVAWRFITQRKAHVHRRHVEAGVREEVAGREEPPGIDLGDAWRTIAAGLQVDAEDT